MRKTPVSTSIIAIFLLSLFMIQPDPAAASYKDDYVEVMNYLYGNVCDAKIEGWITKTLKINWTSETALIHTIKIFAEIGDAKMKLYQDGVRYFKFPNDAGGYNIMDWKTGKMESTSESAPYYFSD